MTQTTENNLRTFMRQCQQFWMTQWVSKRNHEGVSIPTPVTYEQSLIGVYADMRCSVIDKPNVYFAVPNSDIITEADCCRVFNTEFSDSWEDAKKHYAPGQVLPYPIIPNYCPIKTKP